MNRVVWVSQVTLQLVISFTPRPVLAGGTELLIESAGKEPCRRWVGVRCRQVATTEPVTSPFLSGALAGAVGKANQQMH